MHDNPLSFWPIYPGSLRKLFIRAFTAGLRDPDARVMENEWRKEMCALRDAIFHCPHCGAENFFDVEKLRQRRALDPCWGCQSLLSNPPRMRMGPAYGSQLVIATADVRSQFGAKLASVYAPQLIASFGTGADEIAVRVIAANGPGAFRSELSADLQARKSSGTQLAGNAITNVLPAGSAAGAAVRSADSRSEAVISAMMETAISGGDTAPMASPIGA